MFTLKDLKHLDVMADLANRTPKQPETIDISKLISTNHVPTMGENILSLCTKLRVAGFTKQADSLENKFIQYKVAGTHLYRAIDEDGEDLLNAAHPDGENAICDADKDLGTVETLITQHKKIVDMINKDPVGKLASIKIAQNLILVSTLAKQFSDAANYIEQYFIEPIRGTSIGSSPTGQMLLKSAIEFYNLFQDLFINFNKQENWSEASVLSSLKNALRDTVGMIYINKLHTTADIDTFITEVQGSLGQSSARLKNASLSMYVDQCAKIVNADWKHWDWGNLIGLVPGGNQVKNVISEGAKLWGDVFYNASNSKTQLEKLLSNSIVQSNPVYLNKIKKTNLILDELLNNEDEVKSAIINTDKSQMDDYTKNFIKLNKRINSLIGFITKLYRKTSGGEKTLSLLIGNDLLETKQQLYYLSHAITAIVGDINLTNTEDNADETSDEDIKFNNKLSVNHQSDPSFTKSPATPKPATTVGLLSAKPQEIVRLQNWQKQLATSKIDAAKHKVVNDWIVNQLNELQNVKTQDQLNEIIQHDNEFETQLKKLEGAK